MNKDSCLLKIFQKTNLNALTKNPRIDINKVDQNFKKKCAFYIISIETMVNNNGRNTFPTIHLSEIITIS